MNITLTNEKENTSSLINQIEQLAKKAKKSKLKLNFEAEEKIILKEVSEFLDCTPWQTVVFAVIFQLSFKNDDVSISDIAEYLNCSPLRVLEKYSFCFAYVLHHIFFNFAPSFLLYFVGPFFI